MMHPDAITDAGSTTGLVTAPAGIVALGLDRQIGGRRAMPLVLPCSASLGDY
jgi:hypothetical protein